MKRVLSILMAIMLLAACQPGSSETPEITAETEGDKQPNDLDSQLQIVEEDSQETTSDDKENKEEEHLSGLTSGWLVEPSQFQTMLPYTEPEYTPSMSSYSWAKDLSDLHNAGQYHGFTEGQIDMINKNGFVVLQEKEGWSYPMMHQGYEEAEYSFNPIFISSDIVLHMYRTYYSESMKTLELTEYLPSLKSMTASLYDYISEDYAAAEDAVRSELKYVYAYIAVANELLGTETETPHEVAEMVSYELDKINEHAGRDTSMVFDKMVDYSQYNVRGHYTLHEDLTSYFKTMMWFGQSGFQMTDNGELLYDGIARACMLTDLIFRDETMVRHWNSIYELTKLYSGYSDDLSIYDMKDFMLSVYGNSNLNLSAYIDESYRSVIDAALLEIRQPDIVGDIELTNMATGLECRLMGQRFTLDGYIMQNLMKPVLRPEPTAYDVMTAFGHSTAEEILYGNYKTNQDWDGYDTKMEEMKTYVADYGEAWQSNLYNGWLWAIDAAAESTSGREGLPVFMQSKAWDQKSLTAALGSYAELKHDNVLYSKQAVAERGGEWYEDQEYHYIEPNVPLYSRLLWLAEYTKLNLTSNGSIDEDIIEPLDRMIELLDVMVDVSVKELQEETVTDEEFRTLRSVGGYIDYLKYTYKNKLYQEGVEMSEIHTSALVSDVATTFDDVLGDTYLEEATGMPYELYVVCHVNDTTFMAQGWVFSFYEFLSTERLTDNDWAEKIGFTEDGDFNLFHYVGPAYKMTEVMPWTKSYVSTEPNMVQAEMVELTWGE